MKIPLFDIAWTLLQGNNKAHQNAFHYAFKTVYGIEAYKTEINTDGMIDSQIILEILKLHGISPEKVKQKLPETIKAIKQ